MDDRERKLSFCYIFAEALVVCVLCVLKILIIVSDLEQNSNQVDKGDIVTNFCIENGGQTCCLDYMLP